ncbi:MAG: LysR family transcriptional regulator [Hyphomonadaceae bacterium]|jgi:DNA-binding transcriptional LysR family regulator|nr:LysR family transcriptional regulator [Hyphomonadaceae bacterium]
MSKLENIRVMTRAVELGSFSAAGRSMRLSAAVVSHRIRSLEQELGCRLFNRTTRKMHLTEQGRVFYENCLEVIQALDRAEASIADRGAAPRGLLKVTAPLGFGQRVVAPLLPRFQELHPEIDVFLRLSDYLVDLFTEAVDVAVRMAVLSDSSLIVRKIAGIERVLCAAPAYLERHGMPRSVADLTKHRCLLLRYPGSKQFKWTLAKGQHQTVVPVTSRLDADVGDVLTDWALAGEGIALKPVFEVAKHLRSGALVTVLPEHRPVPVTLAILHAYQRMVPPKVRAFADLLVEEARTHIEDALAEHKPQKARARRA